MRRTLSSLTSSFRLVACTRQSFIVGEGFSSGPKSSVPWSVLVLAPVGLAFLTLKQQAQGESRCEDNPLPFGVRLRGAASPNARYRMVVTDLDGTLLDAESRVSEVNRGALREIVGPQCPLVLATARGFMENIPYEDLPGPLYMLASGGAHGLKRSPGEKSFTWVLEELFLASIEEEVARKAVTMIEALGATVWVCQTDRIFVKEGRLGASDSAEIVKRFIPDPSYACVVDSLEPVLAANRTIEVCAVGLHASGALPSVQAGLAEAGIDLEVLSFAPDVLVSLKAPGVNKASALKRLCSHLGTSVDAVVAFGDSTNDVPMLQSAGLGIAMANANEAAQESANIISKLKNTDNAVGCELLRLRSEGQI